MMPNALCSAGYAVTLLQPLFAHGVSSGLMWYIWLLFDGPFIVAAILLIAGVLACFQHRRAAKVCLVLAAVSCLVGCAIRWADQARVNNQHAMQHAVWADQVATNPNVLCGYDLDDDDLKLLRNATGLRKLELKFCSLTEAGLKNLAGLNHLETLNLDCSLHDHANLGLACLKGLTQLQELNISDNYGVTDVELEHLKGLTQLRKLDLCGTQVTDAGVAKLQKALPNCKITR